MITIDFLNEHSLTGYLENPLRFVQGANLYRLLTRPFHCELFFEHAAKCLEFRRQLVALLKLSFDPDDECKFAIWLLYRVHQLVYLPIHVISHFCTREGIDLEDAISRHLKCHPKHRQLYTTMEIHQHELNVVQWLKSASVLVEDVVPPSEEGFAIDDAQERCVHDIIASKFMTLQGSAGCGKTVTIAELINRICTLNRNIEVHAMAFTHKAKGCLKQRLTEIEKRYLNVSVSTIHSFIGKLKLPGAAAELLMKPTLLIIDEASMIDLDLLGTLAADMMQYRSLYQVCFVGDKLQLPPVGRGEFFRALLEHKVGCELTKCYRTDFLDIEQNYERLRHGQMPVSTDNFDVTIVDTDSIITKEMKAHINKHLDSYKIICWQNQHIKLFNKLVQEAKLAARQVGPGSFRGKFYDGDTVMYVGENDDHVTNALLGKVTSTEGTALTICWENGYKKRYKSAHDIILAYALTAHKAQGSEYDMVIIPVYDLKKMAQTLDRRWLYTACTRGKQYVRLVSTPKLAAFIGQPLRSLPINNIDFASLVE